MKEQNIKSSLLDDSSEYYQNSIDNKLTHHSSQQNNNQSYISGKKRMTSLKSPPSQYKNVITKIFCHHYPIKSNHLLDKQCKVEIGFLYIGGCGVINSQFLKKHQIKAVLSVIDHKKCNKQRINQKIDDIDQIQQHQFIDVAQDQDNISPYLQHSYNWITQLLSSNCNVLVHSYEGLSRAPVIVINYIMRKYKLKYQQAYSIVKERKPEIQIKEVFKQQLSKIIY